MKKAKSQPKSCADKFIYSYARPMLTADAVILAQLHGRLNVLLVRRKHPPFSGSWALPGGYVNRNEQALDAARRELTEETGLTRIKLLPIGFFDTPGRDPRGWTVSVIHLGFAGPRKLKQLKAGDDAAQLTFKPLHTRAKLAFDHAQILRYAARWLKKHRLPKKSPILTSCRK